MTDSRLLETGWSVPEPPFNLAFIANGPPSERSAIEPRDGVGESSKLPWPFLSGVEDSDDLKAVASQPVRDDVPCAWHDQFSGAGDASRTTEIGQLGEAFDGLEQITSDSIGSLGIVARDIRAEMSQMLDGSERPDDGHTRGALRSRFRPHDRSQFATSLCGTPRPSSSSSIPA